MEEPWQFVDAHKGEKEKLWAWGILESGEDSRGYGRMAKGRKREGKNVDGLDKDTTNMKGTEVPVEQYLYLHYWAVSYHQAVFSFFLFFSSLSWQFLTSVHPIQSFNEFPNVAPMFNKTLGE